MSTALDRKPSLFRNRFVLVGGGDLRGFGDDHHRIPHRAGRNTAISTLQAMMVDTIGARLPIREPGRIPMLAATVLGAALAMAGALLARRVGLVAVWLAAAAGVYMAVWFLVFWWTGLMLPVATPLVVVLLGLVTALILRQSLPAHPAEVSVS